jgi:hypothetical protein
MRQPSLDDLTAFAYEQLGLDFDLDRVAMARLAAIGLTVQAWRNTSLENLHAGDHPSGGFPDSHMMRFNIATSRLGSTRLHGSAKAEVSNPKNGHILEW